MHRLHPEIYHSDIGQWLSRLRGMRLQRILYLNGAGVGTLSRRNEEEKVAVENSGDYCCDNLYVRARFCGDGVLCRASCSQQGLQSE